MIVVNMDKAKTTTHTIRREQRDIEFAPHDKVIALRFSPELEAAAEAERVKIRVKYAQYQIDVDACTTADELKVCIETMRAPINP